MSEGYNFNTAICSNPSCRALVVIDPRMWQDADRCPKCGAVLSEAQEPDSPESAA